MLTVIVPVLNGTAVLPRALEALMASDLPREDWELIVVDDGSTDDTVGVASQWADMIVRLPAPAHGPAYARNRGAEVASGDVLVFIDADVVVHPDTLRRLAWSFASDQQLAAVFGSYDDRPPAQGLASRYRNLLHHYHHQQNPGPAETFWAGCGAIRADAFQAVGRFDEWHYSRPSIEDIELGHRLHAAGYPIRLDPTIQCSHLKRWTVYGMLRTDLLDRGVPWVRLLLTDGSFGTRQSLNLRRRERVFTGLMGLAIVFLGVSLVRLDARWLLGVLACVVPVIIGNVPLYRFLQRSAGLGPTLMCLPLHLAYYILNGFSVIIGTALHHLVGPQEPRPEIQAFHEVGMERWPPVPAPLPRPRPTSASSP
ncbi:MAG: glycosyltransferase [Gemmatimonadales bacterium]